MFARKTVGQIPDHLHEVIRGLKRKPALIGHSFGGLLVQILAGRGLASATLGDPAGASGPSSAPCAVQALKTDSVHNRSPRRETTMATSAERMRALRERERRGLRRFAPPATRFAATSLHRPRQGPSEVEARPVNDCESKSGSLSP